MKKLQEKLEIDTYNQQRLEDAKERVEKSPTSSNYFWLGYEYQKIKEHEAALENYTKAIELDEKYADPYNGRGNVYEALKEYDKAKADFAKAKELDTGN